MRLVVGVLGHAGGFDLLLQLVDFALFAAAQFLLDRLDLLVEVVLFLRLLHLALHAALNGAIDIELFDLDVEHLGDARQPVDRIEDLEQFLLFFDVELQVRADGVGQLAGLVHADGGDHRLVVQVLAELDVLLEQAGDAAGQRIELRTGLHLVLEGADDGAEEAFVFANRDDLGALDAFHQHLDVAVRQLQALDDVGDRADAVDLVGPRLVDARRRAAWRERSSCRPPAPLRAPGRSIPGPRRTGSSCTER